MKYQEGPTLAKLKRKEIKLLLAHSNNRVLTTAVLFVCQHHPGGALNSVEAAIAHWRTCNPTHRAATMKELDALLKVPRPIDNGHEAQAAT